LTATRCSEPKFQVFAASNSLSLTATDINKLQTVFDEDTIFCKNGNLRFLISSPTVCKLK